MKPLDIKEKRSWDIKSATGMKFCKWKDSERKFKNVIRFANTGLRQRKDFNVGPFLALRTIYYIKRDYFLA